MMLPTAPAYRPLSKKSKRCRAIRLTRQGAKRNLRTTMDAHFTVDPFRMAARAHKEVFTVQDMRTHGKARLPTQGDAE